MSDEKSSMDEWLERIREQQRGWDEHAAAQKRDYQLWYSRNLPAYFSALKGERDSPRALAIINGAFFESELNTLIRMYLPGLNSSLRDKMFNAPNASLATAASKLDLARAMNLIDHDLHHDLVLLARIRNRFTHDLTVDTFDHGEVAPLIDKIRGYGMRIDEANQKDLERRPNRKAPGYSRTTDRTLIFEMTSEIYAMILHNFVVRNQAAGEIPSPPKLSPLSPPR